MVAENVCILVVDDNELNRAHLQRRLQKQGYSVISAASGFEALKTLTQINVDLVLLDINMPDINGFEVLVKIKELPEIKHIPVIMVSATDEEEVVVRCIEAGADDYLTKPVNKILLQARVNNSLNKKRLFDQERQYKIQLEFYNTKLEKKVKRQVEELSSAHLAAIFATSKLAESKDPETGAHLERLREFCKVLAIQTGKLQKYTRAINRKFIESIYASSPLHDIGKVGIPDSILLKPGKLNDNEWEIMRTHTVIGAETLRAVAAKHPGNQFLSMGIEIAESHHEKWDGTGYPYGLTGEDIPLSARIVALCDVYDALTSVRCYKPAFSHEESRDIIIQSSGNHFDPDMVNGFLHVENEFIEIKKKYCDKAAAQENDALLIKLQA